MLRPLLTGYASVLPLTVHMILIDCNIMLEETTSDFSDVEMNSIMADLADFVIPQSKYFGNEIKIMECLHVLSLGVMIILLCVRAIIVIEIAQTKINMKQVVCALGRGVMKIVQMIFLLIINT